MANAAFSTAEFRTEIQKVRLVPEVGTAVSSEGHGKSRDGQRRFRWQSTAMLPGVRDVCYNSLLNHILILKIMHENLQNMYIWHGICYFVSSNRDS